MRNRRFLEDMFSTLFERRSGRAQGSDDRSIQDMCRALLNAEGEISGIALAQAILERYSRWGLAQKQEFFAFLNTELEIDLDALEVAVSAYRETGEVKDYRFIASAAEAPRQELLRRLNQAPGATEMLVRMREDLLAALKADPSLRRTDLDFQHLLRSWFNRGFLVLQQISWDNSPANILEKIVEYESVHMIQDWDDLRRRLYPEDRRCFAFFHPSMPIEPLIFVEVALTETVPSSIQDLLSDDRKAVVAEDCKVAVFYSISNCQAGLRGISFGNLLIKQVVAELRKELPGLETFVTLSPIPKLTAWTAQGDNAPDLPEGFGTEAADPDAVQGLAAGYLLAAKTPDGAPFDPVARFHLGNGAQIYAVHGAADISENGLRQSGGAMVNYQYDLNLIEHNHERFVQHREVALAPGFSLDPPRSQKRREARA